MLTELIAIGVLLLLGPGYNKARKSMNIYIDTHTNLCMLTSMHMCTHIFAQTFMKFRTHELT
jgi:hypothetical protein